MFSSARGYAATDVNRDKLLYISIAMLSSAPFALDARQLLNQVFLGYFVMRVYLNRVLGEDVDCRLVRNKEQNFCA